MHHLLCNDTRRMVPLCFPAAGIYHSPLPFSSPPTPSPSPIHPHCCLLPEPCTVHQEHPSLQPSSRMSCGVWARGGGVPGSQLVRGIFWGPFQFCHCSPVSSCTLQLTPGLNVPGPIYSPWHLLPYILNKIKSVRNNIKRVYHSKGNKTCSVS